MLLRFMKNDLKNGRLTNLMMMLFIALSTMLSCASISLIYSSQNQISYFMNDMGKVADYNFSMMNSSSSQEKDVVAFMKEKNITDYQIERDVALPLDVMYFNGKSDLESSGCFATTLPKKYNLIYDEDGNIPVIQKGEVGIPLSMKHQLNLKRNDTFEIRRGNERTSYKITSFIRDPLYGSDMMGQNRILLHPDDFKKQQESVSPTMHALVVSVVAGEHTKHLEYEMQKAKLPNAILVEKSTAELSFLGVSMGVSAMLLVSGIILLCMSFLIIRFTILFQIENNYTEIGIMKAIGFKHHQIKPLYLLKYMGIAIIGAGAGFACSIPFVKLLENMQTGVVPQMPGITGTLLSLTVVFAIFGLVYAVTTIVLRKLKNQSTMDAIRRGNEGETYEKHSSVSLSKTRWRSVHNYLAMNDLMAHRKQYAMMVIIYALCMVLILVPLTLKDAFQKDAFLQILKISQGDLYSQQNGGNRVEQLKNDRDKIEADLKEYDAGVKVEMETMTSASVSDNNLNTSVFLIKRATSNSYDFDEGKAPFASNELAISTTIAKRYKKTVGDSITMTYEGKTQEYLITGIYGSMMNLGCNVLAGDIDYEYAYTGYLVIHLSKDHNTTETIKQIQREYKSIKLIDSAEMMRSFSGDMSTQITMMSDLIILIILLILFALTILFSKLHILRSKKMIALLQSMGYRKKNIRRWLMARGRMQMFPALLLGIGLHCFVTYGLLEWYMESMGMGSVDLQASFIHMFVLYPIAYMMVVWLAQWLVNRTIPAWDIKDLSEE